MQETWQYIISSWPTKLIVKENCVRFLTTGDVELDDDDHGHNNSEVLQKTENKKPHMPKC